MHVNESTALGTSGDVEVKEEVADEPSSSASTSTADSTATTITSTASITSITDASSPASTTDCVSPSRDSAVASSDSVLPVNGLTVSPNSTRNSCSVVNSSRLPLCSDSPPNSAKDSLKVTGDSANSAAVHSLQLPLNGASDSAVETDDSSQDEMLIPPEDVKQELVDSDCQDTVDGTVLHRLSQQDLKLEPEDSNSSCSLASFSNGFLNGESDASMRKRLFTSLSQSFPGSALSRILHSCDTMPMDSDDEDLVTQDRLSSSCFGEIRLDKGEIEDDELTSLAWLQDSDLLKNINAGEDDLSSGEDQKENADGHKNSEGGGGGNFVPQTHPPHVPYNPQKHVNSKPPYSFSCLIFMAVEESPEKKLPVKDIYNWILTHFPYFQNAPTGWKNSVRHNLSLNKCFKKVEKDKGTSIGKGSLWCIDPDYRPNLLQALRKTPYHPYHQLQMMSTMQAQQQIHHVQGLPASGFRPMPLTQRPVPNTVSPHLFPFLSRRLAQTGCEYFDREMQDVANTLVAMKGFASTNGSDASGPNSAQALLKRRFNGTFKRQGPIIVTAHPNEDHNYSSVKIREEDAASATSSIDNEYDFGDEDDDDDISEPSDYPSDWDCGSDGDEVDGDLPPVMQRKRLKIDLKRKEDKDKDEEEKQEGAKLLLSLAGVSSFSGGEDEDEKRSPRKSHSAMSGKAAAASSSSRLAKSSPSLSSKGQSSSSKASASSGASKSSSSLSSSQSSSSSSRTPSKSSSRTPSSKSSSKTSTPSSKFGAVASASSSKTSVGASSSSPKSSAAALSLSKSALPASSKSSLSESSSKSSAVSSSKSSVAPTTSSSKATVSSLSSSSPPTRPASAGSVSSPSASPSSKKASIIMTRRGKAAAEAAAAAAAPGVCTRGKKLSSSS